MDSNEVVLRVNPAEREVHVRLREGDKWEWGTFPVTDDALDAVLNYRKADGVFILNSEKDIEEFVLTLYLTAGPLETFGMRMSYTDLIGEWLSERG